jgi:hypothetical protein
MLGSAAMQIRVDTMLVNMAVRRRSRASLLLATLHSEDKALRQLPQALDILFPGAARTTLDPQSALDFLPGHAGTGKGMAKFDGFLLNVAGTTNRLGENNYRSTTYLISI